MLKSRNNHPPTPGGFQIYVAETNFSTTPYIGFEDTAAELQRHRKANPRFGWPTDLESIRKFMDDYKTAQLRTVAGGEAWIVASVESPPMSFPSRPRQRRSEADVAAGDKVSTVKKVVAGISLIADWLGDSLAPVAQELAEHRATICTRCKLNVKPGAVGVVASVAADGLHLLMDARSDMKLATSHDPFLETCSACLCNLRLKVFTPTAHIKKHTSPEVFAALDQSCWIRTELKST